ncbi:nucleotidyltransferase family protein [uncultured Helcococcus sp.]|uniref:nucleotidyltransferase family protein n=1 Tax=uncultured Helcococcus sp. TaxID=1072508 RepID=UPI00288B1B74|nr:nucleotidyltransferase family protein [uncultured Helcococcus sp.]
MKNIGIIAEYNPMHLGHIHQIKVIKEKYPQSNIIVLMSGSFVQRGEPSILNKFDKAEIAIKNGVDLVLEMPNIVSLQSADYFAYYSTMILNKLNILDYLSFGVESKDFTNLIANFEAIYLNTHMIEDKLKTYLDQGLSYKQSYIRSLDELAIDSSFMKEPNNTLAFNYYKSLRELKSNINVLPIFRNDNGYNNDEISAKNFQSATTIRKLVHENKDISAYVPLESKIKLEKSPKYHLDDYSDLFYYKSFIIQKDPSPIAGYEPGILNLLNKNFDKTLSEAVDLSHNKRHSKARLRRFIFNYLLDITNEDINSLDKINYIRPIAFNDKGRQVLKEIKDKSDIAMLNNFTDIKDNCNKNLVDIDMKSYKLHNIRSKQLNSLDYTHIAYIK